MSEGLAERFWRKVAKRGPDECWPWTGATQSGGYGRVWLLGKFVLAHRVAYELVVGSIPEHLTIDHLCRNRLCQNPAHLEPVTRGENVLRGEGLTARNARKTHCVRGHPLDADNTYHSTRADGRPRRGCVICRRAATREAARRRRSRAKG